MRRINVYLDESDYNFLMELPETFSEHVRRAVSDYVVKLKTQDVAVSASGRKERDINE